MIRDSISYRLRRMRRDWDRRAIENARHYVATGKQTWSDEEFFETGAREVREQVFNDLGNICQGKDPKQMRILEIGCGAGRMTRPLAQFFGEVYAVDISREMVRQARRAVADLSNVQILQNNGRDLSVVRRKWWNRFGIGEGISFDFAISCLVFQHIPSRDVIESYLREVNRLLLPGCLFKFQVQGDTTSNPMPDHSWIGQAFSAEDAAELARSTNFKLRYQYGAGSQYYWLWFFKR